VGSLSERISLQMGWKTELDCIAVVTSQLFEQYVCKFKQGSQSPGKLLEFYVRPEIFVMISRYLLVKTVYWLYHVQVNACYKRINGEG